MNRSESWNQTVYPGSKNSPGVPEAGEVSGGNPPVCVDASRIRHGLSETVSTEDPELRAWIEYSIARDHEHFLGKRGAGALPTRTPAAVGAPIKAGHRGADTKGGRP